MTKTIEGNLSSKELTVGIVVSRFNSLITERLLEGALDALKRTGSTLDTITIIKVPGSFEIPLIAKKLISSGKVDAVICLGAVIKGDTLHNQFISAEVIKGLAQVSMEAMIPVALGVITADSLEQAIERAGTKHGNRGYEAAMSAIEMANLMKAIENPKK
jgi:6,7-dimethyl-8-ribityllumazine synthase